MLDERVAAARHRPEADALRVALDGLRRIETGISDELSVVRHGESATPDLTAEMERLEGLEDEAQQWEQHLQRDLTLARQRAITRLDEEIARVREDWTTRINKSSMQVLRRSPQVFTAQIQTDLLDAMATTAQVFLDDLEKIVTDLFDDPQQWEHIREITLEALQTDPLVTGEVGSKRQGLLDPSVLTMGMIGTTMLGAVIGAGAIAGVAWVAINLGFKAMRTGKTNLLTWLRETLATVRTVTTRMLEAAMATTRPEIVLRRRKHLQDRITELQKRIDEAKRAARADAATRTANIERLEKNLRITRARITPMETALRRCRMSAPHTPPQAAPDPMHQRIDAALHQLAALSGDLVAHANRIGAILWSPPRIVVVGRLKAGKSTLVNALIGAPVAETAALEATNVVTVYENGAPSRADVVSTDGTRRPVPLALGTTVDLGVPPEQVAYVHRYLPPMR